MRATETSSSSQTLIITRTEPLRRLALGLVGGVIVPLAVMLQSGSRARTALAVGALVLSLGGELAERYLFFAAVVRPKMPGGISS